MRGHKRYAEAVDYYTRAIALIDKPEAEALDLLLFARHLLRAR